MPINSNPLPIITNKLQSKGIDYLRAYRALIKGYVAASIHLELQKAKTRADTRHIENTATFNEMTKGKSEHGNQAYIPTYTD